MKPIKQDNREIKEKAFNNWKNNAIHLTFPNGNKLSTVWGYYNYCDNYDIPQEKLVSLIKEGTYKDKFDLFLDSDTCEIMILEAPEKLKKKIHKKYDAVNEGVIGYLTMAQWLDIVKILSKSQ